MGFLKPEKPKGPTPEQIRQREEAARERERGRIAEENAKKQQKAEAEFAEKESKRQAFAGQLANVEEDQNQRKRFLKGA